MTYSVRDEKGVMYAKLANDLAGQLISSSEGEWKELEFTTGKKTVFILATDRKAEIGQGIVMFFWKGTYLESCVNE